MIETFDGLEPRIHPDAWVHQGAYIIGDVSLAEGVGVWPTAVLRGDMGAIRIGANTNIQDGTICHDTHGVSATDVGERVTVGHRVILHGCRVEDDCLIGMGAIIMDNAVIGAGSLIGAGTLITTGKVIPPGSLVLGSPGRIVGQTTDDQRRKIDGAWREYASRAATWRGGQF